MSGTFSNEAIQQVLSAADKSIGNKLNPVVDLTTGDISFSTKLSDLPIQTVNEFYSEITNKLISQDVVDGLNLNAELSRYNLFKDSQPWINGQMEKIGVNIKPAKNGYSKTLNFNDLFNPNDHVNEIKFLQDAFFTSSSAKFDINVISRGFSNTQNFNNLYNLHVKKISDDVYAEFIDNARDNLAVVVPGLATQIEVVNTDPNLLTNDTYKTVVNTVKAMSFKSTDFTANGWEGATGPGRLIIVWNLKAKTNIDFQNAQSFIPSWYTKAMQEFNVREIELPIDDDTIICYVADIEALPWQVTLEGSGSIVLDQFSFSPAIRLWYGFGFLPWLNCAIITPTVAAPFEMQKRSLKKIEDKIKAIKATKDFDPKKLQYYEEVAKKITENINKKAKKTKK